jgi:tRNA threonylcarbamoyladenosine biosynthesis protein TsaE
MMIEVKNEAEMKAFGKLISQALHGGEIIELIGDVGSGKTTLVKGIAIGLGIEEYVQSPSFMINRVYKGRDNVILSHYDFYRLDNAGIMANELQEVIDSPNTITIIEWAEVVKDVLSKDRLSILITTLTETSRKMVISAGGINSRKIMDKLKS